MFRPAPVVQTLLALVASAVFVASGQRLALLVIWPVALVSWIGWALRRRR